MTTPPPDSAPLDVAGISEKLAAATPLPWSYRPEEYDDWGSIRGPVRDFVFSRIGPIVAVSREGGTESDHDQHRRDKTDPYEPNGQLIVAAVNALPALLTEIATLRAEKAEVAARGIERAACVCDEEVENRRADQKRDPFDNFLRGQLNTALRLAEYIRALTPSIDPAREGMKS